MRALLPCLLFAVACGQPNGRAVERAAAPELPDSNDEIVAFAPGTTADELVPAVEQGLRSRGKAAPPGQDRDVGGDSIWFVLIRDGGRYGADFRPESFHVVVGAGVRYPAGALLVRRDWGTAALVDGTNEQIEVWGLAIAVEPGALRPYPSAVTSSVTTFVAALHARRPIHPDCVVAMEEVPYTRAHEADVDERSLARAARANLSPPPVDGRLTIHTKKGPAQATYEYRDTNAGIKVGMMLRRRFDGENRGMLFEYPHRTYRRFWMRNCPIPIDLAYLRDGKIEQIEQMEPGFGLPQDDIPAYPSRAAVKLVLEMPAGWFGRHGVEVGDRVEIQ